MSKDKRVILHHRAPESKFGQYTEVEILLREIPPHGGREREPWMNTDFAVILDEEILDTLVRDPKNVTYQVHNRIRYDNKPRVRWRAMEHGIFFHDTRTEALADILHRTGRTRYVGDVHIPKRGGIWIVCDLCKKKGDE